MKEEIQAIIDKTKIRRAETERDLRQSKICRRWDEVPQLESMIEGYNRIILNYTNQLLNAKNKNHEITKY